ncbi:MAG TPA: alpha/beta fold hydrolase, partial [Planctomycetia bacterium]|nr:alpha/beta fold hydrolase [Planctomycetia bacterium]
RIPRPLGFVVTDPAGRAPSGVPGAAAANPAFTAGAFTAADGYPLQFRHYPAAPGPIDCALVCIHGIQSHAGWYDRSCAYWAARGASVYFLNRRGSGDSQVARGDAASPEQLAGDLLLALAEVRRREPGKPVVLMGISWGGKVAVPALADHPDSADGLVFVAPGWFPKVSPSLRIKLAIGWSALLWPKRRLPTPLSDPRLFTVNPEKIEFLRQDPHSLRRATARLLFISARLDRLLPGAAGKLRQPSLLVLADEDRIIHNGRTRDYFHRLGAPDATVKLLPGHHTLEFEPDPVPYFNLVADWLAKRFPSAMNA